MKRLYPRWVERVGERKSNELDACLLDESQNSELNFGSQSWHSLSKDRRPDWAGHMTSGLESGPYIKSSVNGVFHLY